MLGLVALAAAATTTVPVRLGPFMSGQTMEEATSAAAAAGLNLRPFQSRKWFQSYWIMDNQSKVRGSLGMCGGKLQFAGFTVDSFDDFTTLLRQRTEQWGQPRVSVDTIEVADASRSIELLTFKWPTQRYELSFSARRADGLTGNQSIGYGLVCN